MFQREEVELAKPYHIWHVTKTALHGVGSSQVGLYPPSGLGRWPSSALCLYFHEQAETMLIRPLPHLLWKYYF